MVETEKQTAKQEKTCELCKEAIDYNAERIVENVLTKRLAHRRCIKAHPFHRAFLIN